MCQVPMFPGFLNYKAPAAAEDTTFITTQEMPRPRCSTSDESEVSISAFSSDGITTNTPVAASVRALVHKADSVGTSDGSCCVAGVKKTLSIDQTSSSDGDCTLSFETGYQLTDDSGDTGYGNHSDDTASDTDGSVDEHNIDGTADYSMLSDADDCISNDCSVSTDIADFTIISLGGDDFGNTIDLEQPAVEANPCPVVGNDCSSSNSTLYETGDSKVISGWWS